MPLFCRYGIMVLSLMFVAEGELEFVLDFTHRTATRKRFLHVPACISSLIKVPLWALLTYRVA